MTRVQLLLCFTVLIASVSLLDVVSAHLNFKPSLPADIEPPQTLKDVEPYTVKVVMVFVSNLEKECPKTNKFKAFFEKLRGYAKYVCPIKPKGQVDYDRDMKAKAGGIMQAISSFAVGKIRNQIQAEKVELVRTFRFMGFVASKILGGKKEETDETMKLTAEQQKEIKDGILRWETIMTKVTNTMVTTTTTTNSSSSEVSSTTTKGGSSESSKSAGSKSSSSLKSGSSFEDTTGSSSKLGSPSSSPSGSSSIGASETSSTKSKSESSTSPTKTKSESSTSGSVETSQSGTVTVKQVEAETSKEVTTFIMNLEKKCPQKEEYKVFFENLKATMIAPPKVATKERKGLFSRLKSAAGKLSGAMEFMRARIGSKSAEVKQSMENYQIQMLKTMEELETIHSQIQSQNKGKNTGSLTCTPAQQTQIKQTITKWEQVTTQFVETAVQSETKSSSTTSSSSSSGKMIAN